MRLAIHTCAITAILTLALVAGPVEAITNGDFSTPGLAGWTVIGSVSDGGGMALLEEDEEVVFGGDSILRQSFLIPPRAFALSFEYSMTFTGEEQRFGEFFSASLSALSGNDVPEAPGALFDHFFDGPSFDPEHVSLDGSTVTTDLYGIGPGTTLSLAFALVYESDNDQVVQATIDNVRLHQAPIPEPMTMLAVAGGLAGLAGYVRRRR